MRQLKVPLPLRVVAFLAAGLVLGAAFPRSTAVHYLYLSGTYFPKTVVTFAAFLIFHLLAAAMAKLMLFHRERAGKTFGAILRMYLAMGAASLIWAAVWLGSLSRLPLSLPGTQFPGPADWAGERAWS